MTTLKYMHSVMDIDQKAVEEDDQFVTIKGVASTPKPDRSDDIVLPEGAQFNLPLPLLWQHRSSEPIGHVTEATVKKTGITIVGKMFKGVSPEIDRAINLVKSGLVRGLSIGFRGIQVEQIPNSWGVRYELWEWLELSAVTIPAQPDAGITAVKSLQEHDRELRAAVGKSFHRVVSIPPLVAVKSTLSIGQVKKVHAVSLKPLWETK